MRPIWRRWLGVVCVSSLGLAGCSESGGPPAPETALAPAAPIVKREGVSLADAPVALVSLDGAPPAAADDFRTALMRQFAVRAVASADPKTARYFLRVYLAAGPAADGATLDYVIDVYDRARARRARLGDGFSVKGSGDAWSQMSAEALDSVAAQCADEVAAFLSNTPEAKPATYAQ